MNFTGLILLLSCLQLKSNYLSLSNKIIKLLKGELICH